jgi:peptidoglycan/xylan/chitin deacetylase (PgdA/CDA1 family)
MYHYVRPSADGLPSFPYLALADFERQLDYFTGAGGFVDRNAYCAWADGGPAPEGFLLTFDDGLRDHVDFVLPALERREIFGIFYVPSKPILEGEFLDVHKVHLALGRIGGESAFDWLAQSGLDLSEALQRFETSSAYRNQEAAWKTSFLKYLFNWEWSSARSEVLDALLDHAFPEALPLWQEFYMDAKGIRTLVGAGMGVGPHGHTHVVATRLTEAEQERETALSTAFSVSVGGGAEWGYCYPYGAAYEPKVLERAPFSYAFGVEQSDINVELAAARRYDLPRHNCNAFPHGAVAYGATPSGVPAA